MNKQKDKSAVAGLFPVNHNSDNWIFDESWLFSGDKTDSSQQSMDGFKFKQEPN